MADLKKLKRALITCRTWTNKSCDSLERLLCDSELDAMAMQAAIKETQKRLESFEVAQAEYERCVDDDEVEPCINEASVFTNKINSMILQGNRSLKVHENSTSNIDNEQDARFRSTSETEGSLRSFRSSTTYTARLPKLELPKFSGEPTKWPEFWGQFLANIHDTDLPVITKFSYLQSLLSGDAKAAIQGMSLTPGHYSIAIDLLKRRFGRKENIVFAHIQQLLNISVPKGCSVSVLWKLRDELMAHIRSLETLDIHGSQYGVILTPLILSRLPEDIRMMWAREGEGNESDLDYLLEFLEKEIMCRERSHAYNSSKIDVKTAEQRKSSSTAAALYSGSGSSGNQRNSKKNPLQQCAICDKRHETKDCWSLTKSTLTERKEKVRKHKLCYRCLSQNHFSKQCTVYCKKCNGSHHSLLCEIEKQVMPAAESDDRVAGNESNSKSSNTSAVVCSASAINQNMTYTSLPLCRVTVNDIPATVLFDSGADKSFVSSDLVKRSKPKYLHKEMVQFASFGGGKSQNSLKNVFSLQSKGTRLGAGNIIATEVSNICAPMIRPTIPKSKLKCFGDICFAESGTDENKPIVVDIIIGQDQYWKFVTGQTKRGQDDLVAIETVFGWVLTGSWFVPIGKDSVNKPLQCMSVQLFTGGLSDLSEFTLKNFWDLESIGISPKESSDESVNIPVINEFNENITFNNGRYTVSLPWNKNKSELLNNKNVAICRLNALMKRLDSDPELRNRYNNVFHEYVKEGFIEDVPKGKVVTPIYYMPHRPVVKESSSTTKVRPVFDASSPGCNGISLNHCVEAGPPMLNPLNEILLRFRRWKVALSADISKAFLQIVLQEADRDVHRFLWNDSGVIREMRFTRVPFGNKSSPFLLNATVKYHLTKYGNSETIKELLDNLYVDDWLSGADSDDEASSRYEEAKSVIGEAGMVLSKWNTNSVNVQTKFVSDFGEKQVGSDSLKVLGSGWDPISDSFVFADIPTFPEGLSCTKRLVLSLIARIFDPLGFLAPVAMFAKFILQELWCVGVDWDDEAPDTQKQKFDSWIVGLKSLTEIKIPRCYEGLGKWTETLECMEFHAFCDASEKGFGAVIYCRVPCDGGFRVSFVTSKGKVAPLKKVTLPRLELLGALLCARLITFVFQALKIDMGSIPLYCWSDSMVALGWIKGDPGRWKPFVANRVREIQDLTSPSVWRHVDGVDNPADIISRGMISDKLSQSSMWWSGPKWLSTETVPSEKINLSPQLPSEEEEHAVLLVTSPPLDILPVSRYGSLEKTLRVTGWVLRFIYNCRNNISRKKGDLSQSEISNSRLVLFKLTQGIAYHRELSCLREGIPIKKDSPLYKFAPIIGNDGLLRVGGRLQRSALAYEEKHPIILPKCHLSFLLVRSQHYQNKHVGVDTMVSMLRCTFWIFGLRVMAKQIKRKCVKCRIIDAPPCNQVCGPLPTLRVNEAPPFTITGMDYAGPLFTNDSPGHKYYILLFTCAVVRAIHLELVESLSVDDCLRAIRRFSARRGNVKTFYSDNAKTFVGVSKVISAKFGSSSPNWNFIAPRSPWWGGWWERLVRSVKSSLKKSIGVENLSRCELETYLVEIEACVNSRPLTFVGSEVDSVTPLTPSHFLTGRSSGFIVDVNDDSSNSLDINDAKLREKYDIMQQRLDVFWSRWSNEYLKNLPTSVRGSKELGKIKIGSVVLVREDNIPRLKWPMGVVMETYPGTDNVIRTVLLKTAKGKIVRSVQRLHDLEIIHNNELENEQDNENNKSNVKVSDNVCSKTQTTRSGRVVKKNRRFEDYDV